MVHPPAILLRFTFGVLRVAFSLAVAIACLAAVPASASADLGILRVFGSEGKGYGQFLLPDGIAVDDAGTIWVADRDANRILRFANDGTPRPFKPFRYQPWSSAPGRFRLPYDIDVDGLGSLFVADTQNHRIQVFTPEGKLIRKWGRNGGDGSSGTGDGEFNQPRDLALDAFGNVWVADHENKRVQKFTADGRFLARFGANGGDGTLGTGPGEFNSPRGLSSDAQGNIYVADDANHRVQKLSNDGAVLAVWGKDGGGWDKPGNELGAFSLPYGTAVDGRGGLWIADTDNNRVVQMTTDGLFVKNWGANGGDGSEGHGPGEFEHTYNIASDCVGNVYVTDEDNARVQVIGDPAYGRPVCPPKLTVSGERARLGARVIDVTATCDRACRLGATANVRRVGARTLVLRSRRVVLPGGGTRKLTISVPSGIEPSDVRGKIGLIVTASGPPGAVMPAKRLLTPQK